MMMSLERRAAHQHLGLLALRGRAGAGGLPGLYVALPNAPSSLRNEAMHDGCRGCACGCVSA